MLGSFLDAGAIDEVHVFIAAKLIGGAAAKTPVAGAGWDRIADGLSLVATEVEMIEGDVYLRGWR